MIYLVMNIPIGHLPCFSIALVKKIGDVRNIGTALLLVTVIGLIYFSVFSRMLSPKRRGALCLATMWLIMPFIPCLHHSNDELT